MRAARCEEYGGPGNVVVRDDIPAPVVTPGHVLVDVAAAAVNFPDLLFIANRYQVAAPLPFTPGAEFAGRVAAVGDGVTGLSVADPVYGTVFNGAMAEQVLAPARSVAPVPEGLSMTEAAAFRVTYLTAYHALVTAGGLRPGQWVVVPGAAGGVGTATIDVAVRLGARVIAAASSAERLKVCLELGAEAGIDYVNEDLKQRIRDITGDGADLVVDPVGDRWAEPALRAVRWGGRFVTVGFAGGDIPRIPLNIVLLKNITVRGLELRTWTERLPEETARAGEALTELVASGLRPAVSEVYDLADIGTALRRVAGRAATGKVVIRVAPGEGWQRQAGLFKPVIESVGAREGATAFAEKRAPV
jgi:NADPH2:quinone reductase